jgi:hypothetical protein
MSHVVFTLIKWLFLGFGIGLLAAAIVGSTESRLAFAVLGAAFTAISGAIFGIRWWNARNEALLRQHGHLVQADFQRVEINESLEVNGTNPFRVVAQWHETKSNQLFLFKSANLWFDPSNFVQGRKIPVYVDLSKPSRYHVDTSFLPKVRG